MSTNPLGQLNQSSLRALQAASGRLAGQGPASLSELIRRPGPTRTMQKPSGIEDQPLKNPGQLIRIKLQNSGCYTKLASGLKMLKCSQWADICQTIITQQQVEERTIQDWSSFYFKIFLHPGKLTWNLKIQWFSGSKLIFQGVKSLKLNICPARPV